MTTVMKMMLLTMLLSLWTMWPTMAQEFPKLHKSSSHVGNSNNDPVAHQEANIEAKVTNLRNNKRSIDASSIEETASGQELESKTWSRFLFPLKPFDWTRNKNRSRGRTPATRKKTTTTRKRTTGTNENRRKYILGKERVQEIRTKHARRRGGRQKRVAPTPQIVESPVASPVLSPIALPTLPTSTKQVPPTPAPVTPTPAPVLPTPRPVLPTPTPISQPVPTVTGVDAPSAPSSPVAR